jgi:hypothetical protein
MIIEGPYRIAVATGTLAAMALLAVSARACTTRGPVTGTPAAAHPTDVAVPVAPRESSPSPASPAVKADGGAAAAPAIPTRTVPCFDDDQIQLVADGGRALLCWGERCLPDLDDPAATVARPAPANRPPETVVGAEQVCSGARCDRLGPRLRAAVADAAGRRLSATRDHAAIVIGDRFGPFAVWNRAGDRQVGLGSPAKGEGQVVNVDVIGDFLLVARSCEEFCSAIARIVDPRGRGRRDRFASMPDWGEPGSGIVALDADHFLVFGLFGEITLIARDRVVATAELLPDHARQPHQANAQVVRLDERTLVAAWCSGSEHNESCHVTRIAVGSVDLGARGEQPEIELESDRPLPLCRSAT